MDWYTPWPAVHRKYLSPLCLPSQSDVVLFSSSLMPTTVSPPAKFAGPTYITSPQRELPFNFTRSPTYSDFGLIVPSRDFGAACASAPPAAPPTPPTALNLSAAAPRGVAAPALTGGEALGPAGAGEARRKALEGVPSPGEGEGEAARAGGAGDFFGTALEGCCLTGVGGPPLGRRTAPPGLGGGPAALSPDEAFSFSLACGRTLLGSADSLRTPDPSMCSSFRQPSPRTWAMRHSIHSL
mmetsp:Transcript_37782/g.87762  ORF Transcript_37782/g.87762 Transcript_37782/m.87762 type:complete len:240 (+) Transcript_37782:2096-2815(+)